MRDLPLREFPARSPVRPLVAIFLTGDGGWAELDRTIADDLKDRGIGVVGLHTRVYLQKQRNPDRLAADVARVARFYLSRWGGGSGSELGAPTRLLFVGYSRGADMLPFIVARLPQDIRERISLVAMLGLAPAAGFEFHMIDMIRDVSRPTDLPVAPELARISGVRMLCIYGTDEKRSGCRGNEHPGMEQIARPGGHHFDSDYHQIADIIIREVSKQP